MPRPKKYTDAEILEKAMFLFWKKGYGNTSLKDLESTLGITASSIYHAYGNKEQLFIKSVENYIDIVVDQRITQFLEKDDSPISNIQNFFLSLVDNPEIQKAKIGCLLTNTATEIGDSIPEISEKIQEGMEKIKRAFYKELERARKDNQLISQRDTEELTISLFLGYQGLSIMLRLGYPGSELRKAALSALKVLDS